jgi:hypothetical protein
VDCAACHPHYPVRRNEEGVFMQLDTDVLVVGGGVAGVCAAVAAARAGARVTLAERNGFLGGAATAAAVSQFMGWRTERGTQVIAGLGQEIIDRLVKRGGSHGPDWGMLSGGMRMDRVVFDPDVLKVVFDEMLIDAGVMALFHSMASGVEVSGRTVRSVSFLTKSGTIVFTPKVVIDVSGDLDVLHMAGCKMLPLEEGEQLQPATAYFRMGPIDFDAYNALTSDERTAIARKGVEAGALGRLAISCYPVPGTREAWFNVTRIPIDGTDAFALSRGEMEQRRQALKAAEFIGANVPGCIGARLTAFAPQLGIRETRRVRGHVVVTEDDLRSGRRFPDSIAIASFPIDVHETNGAGTRLERVGGPDHVYHIPLGALIPVSLDNALAAGRGVSATHTAFSALRIMPQSMAMGQAAGATAALASKRNTPVDKLPFDLVRAELLKGGAILEPPQAA